VTKVVIDMSMPLDGFVAGASEPAARPSPIVNTASPRFQAIVANSAGSHDVAAEPVLRSQRLGRTSAKRRSFPRSN
jgi:hypothetical protein